ncbi:MAG: dTMP kinase [Candidatus Acidiferrales bacterium]
MRKRTANEFQALAAERPFFILPMPLRSEQREACVRLSATLMPARGKFIALEGIDGSGKRTQLEMLSRALRKRSLAHVTVSFPHYEGFFGRMVARYLNGEFGGLSEVDAHFSALLYAGDRLENKKQLEGNLAQGKMILADRYIGSNLAHQGARVPRRQLAEFLRWLEQLEYGVYGLPREDIVIYLRLPAAKAQAMVGKKSGRGYTRRRHDLQEANLAHLKAAASIYDRLAKRQNWRTIDCVHRSEREMLAPEAIHRQVMEVVEGRILRNARRSGKS